MAIGGLGALVFDADDVADSADGDALVLVNFGCLALAPVLAHRAANVLRVAQVDESIQRNVVIGAVLAIVNAILERVEQCIAAIACRRAPLKRHRVRLWMRIIARKRARRGGGAVDAGRIYAASRNQNYQQQRWQQQTKPLHNDCLRTPVTTA